MRNLMLILTCVALCVLGANVHAADAANTKKFTIALIAKSSTNPVFLAARKGAEAKAAELTKATGTEVVIDWKTPPTEDGQVQAQRIEQAVNEGANAILLSASDAGKLTRIVNNAIARGVPVMTFDSDVPASKRFSYYGVDDMEIGRMVMENLAPLLGGKGRVAILAGNQNAPNLRKRAEGVLEEAKKHPGIEIAGTFYHVETPQDAAAEVIRQMKADPNITGWAMIGGWPLFTTALLTQLDPAKVKVVSVDALPAELPYVEKGIVPVLLAQLCYDWGYVSTGLIYDKVMLGKDVPAINKMVPEKVTQENLGAWARKLKAWGFDDVPQKYLEMK